MLRFLLGLLFLSSCSLGIVKSGGEHRYVYDFQKEYSSEELKEISPYLVKTSQRDPHKGKNADLFSKQMPPLKRIGILVFETTIQETRSALAGEDKVYLSAAGKQLLTEKMLSTWEERFPILCNGVEYVKVNKIKNSKFFMADGSDVPDLIQSERQVLFSDDIYYLPSGKTTTMATVINPRGMRDFSLALVSASELMNGPKFSEHAKHTVNDVAQELKLDALIIVMSTIYWKAGHSDKHSGDHIAEEAFIKIDASTLVPFSSYHERLYRLGIKNNHPKTTVAYRTYESILSFPVTLTIPDSDEQFENIQKNLLTPVLKTYNDLSHMVQLTMVKDLKRTF